MTPDVPLSEQTLLETIFPVLPSNDRVVLGPGDDTAVVRVPSRDALVTTDTMVRGRDWLDEWSSAQDVGAKCVAQNLADIASMGGVPSAVVVTLVADPQVAPEWALGLNDGVAEACRRAGVAVVGGDLSSAPEGMVSISITALGEMPDGLSPVLRSGARPGHAAAVSGPLGRAAAGLLLLQRGITDGPDVAWQRRPEPDFEQGPQAARAGASAMLDVSDGLIRDAGRVAAASGVVIELKEAPLRRLAAWLDDRLSAQEAFDCVLTGGEEHVLFATFPPGKVPEGWAVIGQVGEGAGVTLDGVRRTGGGWDHFGPGE